MREQHMRGQVSSIDMVMAAIVLILATAYLISTWNVQVQSAVSESARNRMQSAGLSTLNYLVTSRGMPENWTSSDATPPAIGLVSQPHVLSRSKLSNFTSMNYTYAKNCLGLTEDFYFWAENASDNQTLYSLGWNNASNTAYSLARYGLLDNSTIRLRLKIYVSGQ